jgi:hypothetical protein
MLPERFALVSLQYTFYDYALVELYLAQRAVMFLFKQLRQDNNEKVFCIICIGSCWFGYISLCGRAHRF